MPKEMGRVDWRPQLKVWSAIKYVGNRDVEIGRYQTYEEAAAALQQAVTRPTHNSPSMPRTVSAAVTGVATGLLGTVIPVVGLTAGVIITLLEPTNPQLAQFSKVSDGVVDGSAALLARALLVG